ncbi:MAG: DNA-binding response regulator [Chloroflexi bacterium]|nr:MAG: DNA-binding response regulator [Chloroflexota bacterium]
MPTTPPIRILLVDDHTLVRQGIRRLLEDQPDLEVVGEAGDGQEAVAKAAELQPDVILMDIGMPGMNGLEATERIKQQFPDIQVLLLTVHDDEEYLFRALKVGASGYVLKEAETTELMMAIDVAHRGEMFLYPSITRRLVHDYLQRVGEGGPEERQRLDELTERQREVLQLIAEGLTTEEIAEKLVISPYTVQTHRHNIMRKLNLHSRTELIKYALRHGLTE